MWVNWSFWIVNKMAICFVDIGVLLKNYILKLRGFVSTVTKYTSAVKVEVLIMCYSIKDTKYLFLI